MAEVQANLPGTEVFHLTTKALCCVHMGDFAAWEIGLHFSHQSGSAKLDHL